MIGIIKGRPGIKKLYIQVTSDTVITPQLKLFHFEESQVRPPWGSTLMYELYQTNDERGHMIRVLFNGKTMKVCGKHTYCTLEQFFEILDPLLPTPENCPYFFERYEKV